MAFTKIPFSGSTNGRQIKVAATATPGTTIHTAQAGTGSLFDEIWAWAYNSDTSTLLLTLEWGGTSAPDDNITYSIPAGGEILIAPGWILQNSLIFKAFCGTTNKVVIGGYVNRNS